MALSTRILLRVFAIAGWLLRNIGGPTLRIQVVRDVDAADPRDEPRRRILSLWHEDLLVGLVPFMRSNLKVLVSQSKDGEFISKVVEALGCSTVRGSSKRGGAQALREMLRVIDENCIAIMADGPKGPRQKMKDGLTFLASRAGVPITPVALAYGRAHRFNSWDKFAFPWVFSTVVIYLGPALHVPESADKDELARFTEQLQERMDAAQVRVGELLDEWLRTGKRPATVEQSRPQLRAAA